jgi:hypothetical protein
MIRRSPLVRIAGGDPAPNRDLGFALLVSVAALALRIVVGLRFAGEPVWDGHYYHFGATRLALGLGYSEDVIKHGVLIWKPWTHYPVGYSLWLSLWYRLLGSHLWVAPISNALIGALTVLGVHGIALPALGLWRARLAAVITLLHPGLILYTAVTMSEPLAALLLILSVWAIAIPKPRAAGRIVSGILLGASALVRPSSLAAIPLYWFVLGGTARQKLVSGVAIAAACFTTIMPWTLRNCHRMDGCALVSTNAGWNLAIGALTNTGRFRPLHAADGCPVVTGQVQQDRCWMRRGWTEIRRNPGHFVGLAPKKLAQTFDHESFAVEYLREANPRVWPEARRIAWREHLTVTHRWLIATAALAVVSIVVGRRFYRSVAFYVQLVLLLGLGSLVTLVFAHDEHPFYWLILVLLGLSILPLPGRPRLSGAIGFSVGFVGLTALTHVFFFGDDRYHLVVSPLLCILAAAALRLTPVKERGQRLDLAGPRLASDPNSEPRSS